MKVYSDGGARGNPGPSAAAFLIFSESGEAIKAEWRFLGRRTNNQAEYEAIIAALESAARLGADEVECNLDSELVGKHLTGEYRVKNPGLKTLWNKVQELKRCFKHVTFINVPRTNKFIKEADKLVNECLDQQAKY